MQAKGTCQRFIESSMRGVPVKKEVTNETC